LRKLLRISAWVISCILLLAGLAILAVRTEYVQNRLVGQATRQLSARLGTEVKIDRVSLSLFNRLHLEGLLVRDLRKDTLLHAGELSIRLTDWFFLRDETDIRYIGLNDVLVNTSRSDSVWNYQFLVDAFSSPNRKDTARKRRPLLLKRIEVNRLRFSEVDAWAGRTTRFSVRHFDLDADEIDLDRRKVFIHEIDLKEPFFSIDDFPGNRPPRPKAERKPQATLKNGELQWNPDGWDILAHTVRISNGRFRNDLRLERDPARERPVLAYFDNRHLDFQDIHAEISNLGWFKDTVSAQLLLSTNERSGLEVLYFTAEMKLDPDAMAFDRLEIRTPHSSLRERFVMRYDDFLEDMSDFEQKVRLEGDFRNSTVRLSDLACFAPDLKGWDRDVRIEGRVEGTVEDLTATGFTARYGLDTELKGDFRFQGLPDLEKTRMTFLGRRLHTTYRDAVSFIPELAKVGRPDLAGLASLDIEGDYQGTFSDFRVKGRATTALGSAGLNLAIRLPDGRPIEYEGSIETDGFLLGKFLSIPDLGSLRMAADIRGQGMDAKALADVDIRDAALQYRGYTYQGMAVKASIASGRLSIDGRVRDEHLQAIFRGGLDLDKDDPAYDMETDVARFDLQGTGLTKRDMDITGGFGLHVHGRDIDALRGEAELHALTVRTPGKTYNVDGFSIRSETDSAGRHVTGGNRDIRIAMDGHFLLSDIPGAFTTFLSRYYPNYFQAPPAGSPGQDIRYSIALGEIDYYLPILDLPIGGFDNSRLDGEISPARNLFAIRAQIPGFRVGEVEVKSFDLNATGDADSLRLSAQSRLITFNDSLDIPGTALEATASSNISRLRLNTTAGPGMSSASLSVEVAHLADGVRIHFNPSAIVLNDKTWRIERDGELTISRSFIGANDIRLVNGQQAIQVSSLKSTAGRTNDILVTMHKVNLGDLLPYVLSDPHIEGLTSGDITIEDPYGKLNVYLNAQTEQTRFEGDSIGIISLNGNWNQSLRKATFFMNSANEGYVFDLRGNVILTDSGRGTIDTEVDIGSIRLGILSTYLDIVFSDIQGSGTGRITVSGPLSEPDITGKVTLKDANVEVDYTKCRYRLTDATLTFKPDLLDIGDIRIRDVAGNEGIVKGQLSHHFFRDMHFDFTANSRKLQVLNTEKKDNDLFYGKATGRVNFRFSGPEDDMRVSLQGEVTDSSRIVVLTTSTSKERAEVDYIVWKEYGREMDLGNLSTPSGNLGIELDLKANALLRVDVVLDELSGDIISAIGTGNLKIRTGTKEATTMNGRYNIESGSYSFNFQDIFKKPFTLERGSGSYISWTGDPYDAEININASYFAEKVRMSTLFSDPNASTISGVSQDVLRESSDVNVLCHLTGTLSKPNPAFQIALPAYSVVRNNPTVDTKIKAINRDPLEVSKQATYLIVFKSFAPQAAVVASSMNQGLFNSTISGVISGILTNSVQNFFYRLFGSDVDVNFNYQRMNTGLGGTGSDAGASAFRENVSLQFIKSMMNDKLVITFGSDFNFTTNSRLVGNNQSFLFLPDVNVEYRITPDGRFRTSFFFRSSFDALSSSGKRDRTGGNLSFRTEFDKIFGRRQ
jgi:hypothetical protein